MQYAIDDPYRLKKLNSLPKEKGFNFAYLMKKVNRLPISLADRDMEYSEGVEEGDFS
jgi:hypothetical protein